MFYTLLHVANQFSFVAFRETKIHDVWQDGTVSTVKGCFTVVRDFKDVCYHSYFAIMNDLREQGPPNGKSYEIRFAEIYQLESGSCQTKPFREVEAKFFSDESLAMTSRHYKMSFS